MSAITPTATRSMISIRITRLGALILPVLFLFYVASLTSLSGLLLFLVGIFLGCYVVNGISAWRSIRHLQIETPRRIRLVEGQKVEQPWSLFHTGKRPVSMVQAKMSGRTIFQVPVIAPNQPAFLKPDLGLLARGIYGIEPLRLATRFPFGLVEVGIKRQLSGQILVHPAVYPVSPPHSAGHDQVMGGKMRGLRRSAAGTDFAGVRPFQVEDPLKNIHWKSSSKGLGLMVKTFYEELSGRIAVVIDAGHSGNKKILDDCVRAAGSLIFAGLDEGHQVEWIDLKQLQVSTATAFSDGTEILDDLAGIEMAPGCLTAENFREALGRISKKSAVCLVLTSLPGELVLVIDQLANEGRRISVYLPKMESSLTDHRQGSQGLKNYSNLNPLYYSENEIEP